MAGHRRLEYFATRRTDRDIFKKNAFRQDDAHRGRVPPRGINGVVNEGLFGYGDDILEGPRAKTIEFGVAHAFLAAIAVDFIGFECRSKCRAIFGPATSSQAPDDNAVVLFLTLDEFAQFAAHFFAPQGLFTAYQEIGRSRPPTPAAAIALGNAARWIPGIKQGIQDAFFNQGNGTTEHSFIIDPIVADERVSFPLEAIRGIDNA